MSVLERIFSGVRDVLLLTHKVDTLSGDVSELMREVRDQDKRLVRLETLVEVASRNPPSARGHKRIRDE